MPRNDLILRIGADDTGLRRALKQLNNDLVKAGDKLESIGQSLSLRLSAPIAAAGFAAVRSFANFEKLEKSLQAVSGSAREADATLSRLRKLALEPGIDLENAVTASIRLQAVGFEAKKAEDLILQFSKAVTLAGGSGEDLGEVVRQITQIISKGKLLSSDFRVIQERVPAIGIAMQQAFGSTNIEQIRETGISAADFVNRLTEGIRSSKEFQNVQGGLSNSFNNFRQSIEGSLVALGRTISESIDLENVLNKISVAVSAAVDAFVNLSPQTKTLALGIAGVVAAIGPLAIGLGTVLKLLPLLNAGFATLLGPVGLVAIAIGALALAIGAEYLEATAAEKAQRNLNKALDESAQAIQKEKDKVDALVSTIDNETTSKGQKAQAIEELKRISPEYFGQLDVEKSKTEDITAATQAYAQSLRLVTLEKLNSESLSAQEELASLTKQLEIAQTTAKQTAGQIGGGAGVSNLVINRIEKRKAELEATIEALAVATNEAVQKSNTPTSVPIATTSTGAGISDDVSSIIAKTNKALAAITGNLTLFGNASEASRERVKVLRAAITDLQEAGLSPASSVVQGFVNQLKNLQSTDVTLTPLEGIGASATDATALIQETDRSINLVNRSLSETAAIAETGFAKLIAEDFKALAKPVEAAVSPLTQLSNTFDILQAKSTVFGDGFKLIEQQISSVEAALTSALENGFTPIDSVVGILTEKLAVLTEELRKQEQQQQLVSEGSAAASSAFAAAADSQEKGLKGVTRAAKAAAKEFIKAQLAQAIAGQAKVLISQFGLLGIPLAIAGAAAVGGLFNALIPALAQGGIVNSPTLALIGEAGPEAVVPLNKSNQFFGKGEREILVAEIGIDRLYFALKRYERENGRIG